MAYRGRIGQRHHRLTFPPERLFEAFELTAIGGLRSEDRAADHGIAVTPQTKQRAPMPDLNAWMMARFVGTVDIISASMARLRRFYGVSLPV